MTGKQDSQRTRKRDGGRSRDDEGGEGNAVVEC